MGTSIRPELSKKSKYWVEKHRYYELKHFCLQYPIWKKAYISLDGFSKKTDIFANVAKANNISDPVAKCVESRLYYSERMKMIESVAEETAPELSSYILKAVTEGISYEHLKIRLNIPCCKDVYYELYRRFFWLLNKVRQ